MADPVYAIVKNNKDPSHISVSCWKNGPMSHYN